MLTADQKLLLEAAIDSSSLADALEALATICRDKAQHLAENWQDEHAAILWNRAANRVESCAASAAIQDVSIR
jgi:hypothetical protein